MRIKEGLSSQKRSSDFFAELFFQSFHHSQGSADYQYEIFCIYSLVYELLQFDELAVMKLQPLLYQIIQEHIVSNTEYSIHRQVTSEEMSIAIAGQLESIQSALDSYKEYDRDSIIENATYYCINRDFRYRNGRHRRLMSSADYDPLEDKYLSYFCYYALEGHTTEIQALDEMYSLITVFVINSTENLEAISVDPSELKEVISTYYNYHPHCTPNEKTQNLLRQLR